MATYYVRKNGDNGNAGTSPSAAWATPKYALESGGLSAGDIVYVGGGTYIDDPITVAYSGSSGNTIKIIGDIDGSKTGDEGKVIMVGGSGTGGVLITASSRSYLYFAHLSFIANVESVFYATQGSNFEFNNCYFKAKSWGIFFNGTTSTYKNLTIKNCWMDTAYGGIRINGGEHANTDAGILVENTVMIGAAYPVFVAENSYKPPQNIVINHCFLKGEIDVYSIITSGSGIAGSVIVRNSVLNGHYGFRDSSSSNYISENFNVNNAQTPYYSSSVLSGANSKANYQFINDLNSVSFAPGLGDSTKTFSGDVNYQLTGDIFGKRRFNGATSGTFTNIGPMITTNFGVQETGVVHSSDASLKLQGPGFHDLFIPVNASPTNIRIYARYESNYGSGIGGRLPTIRLIQAARLGVSEQEVQMTEVAGEWQALNLATFTPTAKGVVKLELGSYSMSGNGNAYFDTLTVT